MVRKMERWKILLVVVGLWIGFCFARNAYGNYQLKRQLSALEKRLEVLELRGQELRKEIEGWQSPENVERVAREELGLVKPDEVVYILSEPLTDDPQRDVQPRH